MYPLYRYEDEMAARRIGRAGRAYIARGVVYILRRDKIRYELKHFAIILTLHAHYTQCHASRLTGE